MWKVVTETMGVRRLGGSPALEGTTKVRRELNYDEKEIRELLKPFRNKICLYMLEPSFDLCPGMDVRTNDAINGFVV